MRRCFEPEHGTRLAQPGAVPAAKFAANIVVYAEARNVLSTLSMDEARGATIDDPTTLLLRRMFVRAVHASLVSAVACASGRGEEGIALEGFSAVACNPVADLAPAEAVDYVALGLADRGEGSPNQLGESGVACETASDPAGCQAELTRTDDLIDNNVGLDHGVVRYLTTTRGDVVSRLDEPHEIRAWLGEIDSASDAVVLAMFEGYETSCHEPNKSGVREVSDGYQIVGSRVTSTCPVQVTRFLIHVFTNGAVTVLDQQIEPSTGEGEICIGRRPEGFKGQFSVAGMCAVQQFFARTHHLEAASVHAFVSLARELAALGAPAELVRRAEQAAREEVRHALMMERLARRFGARVVWPRVAHRPLRGLEALALDNAVEGCVRETYGALCGTFQAARARDVTVRRTMAVIARDETSHASLAWQVAAWAEPQLSARKRASLRAARRSAMRTLQRELASAPAREELSALMGLPTRDEAGRLFGGLQQTLWNAC